MPSGWVGGDTKYNNPAWGGVSATIFIKVRNLAPSLISDEEIKQYLYASNIQSRFGDALDLPVAIVEFDNNAIPGIDPVIDIKDPRIDQPAGVDGQHSELNGMPYGEVWISNNGRDWRNIFDHEKDEMAKNPTLNKFFGWQWRVAHPTHPTGWLGYDESGDSVNAYSLFSNTIGQYHQDIATSGYFQRGSQFLPVSRKFSEELHQPGYLFPGGYQILWHPVISQIMLVRASGAASIRPDAVPTDDNCAYGASSLIAATGASARQELRYTDVESYVSNIVRYGNGNHTEADWCHCAHVFNRVVRAGANIDSDIMKVA